MLIIIIIITFEQTKVHKYVPFILRTKELLILLLIIQAYYLQNQRLKTNEIKICTLAYYL